MTAFKAQLALGYAGAIGFFVVAFFVFMGYPVSHYVTYSNAILFFVAGTHWSNQSNQMSYKPFMAACAVSGVIFITIAGTNTQIILCSSICYVGLWAADTKLFFSDTVGKAYFAFRTTATGSALLTSAYVTSTIGITVT